MSLLNGIIFKKKKLKDLSKDDLVDLVLDLHGENVNLGKRLSDLEDRLEKPSKNSSNSSIPPDES